MSIARKTLAEAERCGEQTPDVILSLNSEWVNDLAPETSDALADSGIIRDLGTIASIECDGGCSSYVLNGRLSYHLQADGRTLVVREYGGSGVPIDGLDRGPISYANRGEWTGSLGEARRFAISGDLLWSDAFNNKRVLEVTLQGTLLDDLRIAYLNTRISGLACFGDAAPTRVLVDVPALM